MAFLLKSSIGNFVSVDNPVGHGGNNRPDDVMLLQGLLRSWISIQEYSQPRDMFARATWLMQHSIDVDGKWGPLTAKALNSFRYGWVMPKLLASSLQTVRSEALYCSVNHHHHFQHGHIHKKTRPHPRHPNLLIDI